MDQAYLEPEVDSDPSEFVWGVPDLSALRQFLMSTIGWGNERTDEVLVPVIRDMNRREAEGTQANITKFFGGGVGAGAFAPRRRIEGGSKRLESALHRIGEKARGESRPDQGEGGGEVNEDGATAKKTPKRKGKRAKQAVVEDDTEPSDEDEDFVEPRKKVRKSAGNRAKSSQKR